MKITLVFVSTIDGKITRWGNPDVKMWSSVQDKEHFRKLWKKASLIVMGSKTFEAEVINPLKDHLIVVMTSKPEIYKDKSVPGMIEFTDEAPDILVQRLEKSGYKEMLLAGGPTVAASFFKKKLINEIILTIEPKIFGSGGNFVSYSMLDIPLKLIHFEKVNEQGTLILRYQVEYPSP